MSPEASAQPRVARSEDELIKLTRGLLIGNRPLPRARAQRPIQSIGPTAMGLLQQTLARGVIGHLLRCGGWETRRTLVDGRVMRGRLWERHPKLPALRFGPASFELLAWLHAEDLVRPGHTLERSDETTLADDLLHYFAAGQLVRTGLEIRQPAFIRSPLCQLGYADALGELPTVDFMPLASGAGAIVVEALQSDLAARWIAMEQRKGSLASLEQMTQIGRAQTQVLDAWFAAVDQIDARGHRCRDLAGFVAEAARELLVRGPGRRCPDHRWWIRSLSLQAPLSARQAAFTAAAAFLRGVGQLGVWLDEAGLVAHFDEDYEAAQMWLSNWQYLRARPEPRATIGPSPSAYEHQPATPASILDRANTLAKSLESLHSLGVAD